MSKCIKCGSYAFNLYKEGIDQGGLCDVHYWQGRAHRAEALVEQPAQRPWVGLTDDEKKNIFLKWYGKHWAYTKQVQAVMDSVEAKLKEKNSD